MSGEQFAYKLIENEKVGVLPGSIFGKNGQNHVRISFATEEDGLKEGLERIRGFVHRKF